MSEHDEEQPLAGRWRLGGVRPEPPDGADATPGTAAPPAAPRSPGWTSPGAGRPYPGETHAARPSVTTPTPAPAAWKPPAARAPTPPPTPAPAPAPARIARAVPVAWPPPEPATTPTPTGFSYPYRPDNPASGESGSPNGYSYISPAAPATAAVFAAAVDAPVRPSPSPWSAPTQGAPGASPYGTAAPAPPAYPAYRSYADGPSYPSPPTYPAQNYGDAPTYPSAAPDGPPYWDAPASYGGGGGWPPPSQPSYAGWSPAPPPAWAPQPVGAPGRRNGLAIVGIAILVAALLGLAIGGQLLARHTSSGGGQQTLAPAPGTGGFGASGAGGGVGSTGTGLPAAQAQAVAAAVDPSVVDINAKLGYQQAAAAGTGMVLTSDGKVLTNNHVIAGSTSLSATVVGGKTYSVKVLGTDPTEDVALIQLENASGLTPIKTGDPNKLQPGEPIVAVGNAGGLGGTPSVVTGNIEALDQSVTASDMGGGNAEQLSGLIQIDAPLQPGDSGGPLLTAAGQVVGMDTAASTAGRFQEQGSVGFAIPITKAMSITDEIAKGHASSTVLLGLPGFLGVSVPPTSTPGAPAGADVSAVIPGTPADKAGVTAGDVITSIDGQIVDSPTKLTTIMQQHHAGDKVAVGWVDPSGKAHKASITLIAGPAA